MLGYKKGENQQLCGIIPTNYIRKVDELEETLESYKSVLLDYSVTTGAANYGINSLTLGLGAAYFSNITNFPTGKTIIAIIPMVCKDSNSYNRAIVDVDEANNRLLVFGTPNIAYEGKVRVLYK